MAIDHAWTSKSQEIDQKNPARELDDLEWSVPEFDVLWWTEPSMNTEAKPRYLCKVLFAVKKLTEICGLDCLTSITHKIDTNCTFSQRDTSSMKTNKKEYEKLLVVSSSSSSSSTSQQKAVCFNHRSELTVLGIWIKLKIETDYEEKKAASKIMCRQAVQQQDKLIDKGKRACRRHQKKAKKALQVCSNDCSGRV